MLDNHMQQGNELRIDCRRVIFKRCLDMNDRALRNTIVGLGGKINGVPREDGFQITVASEIMAILCLASDLDDLKRRIGNILVAYDLDGNPVFARQLGVQGAATALLKDALKPNLVQTLENNPVFIHGGPFANIAHGCNSVRATKLALKLGDYCITEAGFGADLGAEKFMDIKCRMSGLKPDVVVLVATIKALKYNGGVPKSEVSKPDMDALRKGIVNLEKHIENLQKFGVPVVVTLNKFITDTDDETNFVKDFCENMGADFALAEVWEKGGDGGIELANRVLQTIESKQSNFAPIYPLDISIEDKIKTICTEIYGAGDVVFEPAARKQMDILTKLGFDNIPICMAKTQYSLSDNPALLGRPSNFTITVRDMYVSAGAGFIVVLTGDIMTMPGLPKQPAAYSIDVDKNGRITGLF